MTKLSNILGTLRAFAKGEVSADTLEAYRRAGSHVYDLLKQIEDRRLELKIQGLNPWTIDPASQVQFLCAWNAFVLQTLGDQFLEADYQSDPGTVGYVPPMTADQVLAFYSDIEIWLSRAHQAQKNPAYRLEVSLPADLPPWGEDKPCPLTHLEGMLAATHSLQTHAEAAIAVFETEYLPDEKQSVVDQIRQLLAAASSEAEYAESLWGKSLPQALHDKIEAHAKVALEGYYHLGQVLAMPQLLERSQSDHAATFVASSPDIAELPRRKSRRGGC